MHLGGGGIRIADAVARLTCCCIFPSLRRKAYRDGKDWGGGNCETYLLLAGEAVRDEPVYDRGFTDGLVADEYQLVFRDLLGNVIGHMLPLYSSNE